MSIIQQVSGYFLIFILLFSVGCKKEIIVAEEEQILVEVVNDTSVINGNIRPPDSTIADLTIETYVNKVYISLLGREPENTELSAGVTVLKKNNVSIANREELVDEVLNKDGYTQRLFESNMAILLENTDTSDVSEQIAILNFLLTDSTYAPIFDQINYEIGRLTALKSTPKELKTGTIDIVEVHRRMVNNSFYDDINMGTENFVVSMFQNFLNRYPTANELEEGTQIVDGLGGILFFTQGNSKDDFIAIILDTDNYYESQVRDLYLRYLFREPTSVEVTEAAVSYKKNGDYPETQKAILVSNEYVGL